MFYKITPKRKDEKPTFLYKRELLSEDEMVMIKVFKGSKYLEGIDTIELADKKDKDFIAYVKSDIVTVEKEISKLTELKKELLEALI